MILKNPGCEHEYQEIFKIPGDNHFCGHFVENRPGGADPCPFTDKNLLFCMRSCACVPPAVYQVTQMEFSFEETGDIVSFIRDIYGIYEQPVFRLHNPWAFR